MGEIFPKEQRVEGVSDEANSVRVIRIFTERGAEKLRKLRIFEQFLSNSPYFGYFLASKSVFLWKKNEQFCIISHLLIESRKSRTELQTN